MATLGNIRNRSGLLLAVIGIAMLAFILGDFLKSTNSNTGNLYIGNVLGEDILRQTYQQKVDEGIENWKSQNQGSILNQGIIGQIRSEIWDQYVRELVMENEFSKLGIDVSDDEFFELLQGVNVHPEISKVPAFQDQITGAFDRTRVLGYLKQIDQDQTGEARERWLGFQKYLIGIIKSAKYNSLVSKAMFTTTDEARIDFNSTGQNIKFNYVSIPFSSVVDSIVRPTEKEVESYYSVHKSDYEQDASKDVDFVVYSVVPSSEDDAITKSEITDLIADFEVYEDYELMSRRNSDNTSSRFVYTTNDNLQDLRWEELFDAKKGTVIGPYLSSPGVYRIAKLAEVGYRPDSVKARHILIKPTQTMDLDSVNKKVESLRLAIQNGDDFSLLAQQNSEDQGSAIKGGDLGWFQEGVMVDEFNDICFTAETGALSVVTSQFGVHLIEVMKKSKAVKKVKIAYIDRNIEPSTETFNLYYAQAAQFAGKVLNEGISFDTLITINNLVKRTDNKVTVNKPAISGLPNSREMVRWIHDADVYSVSEVFQFDNSYVVAYITKEYIEGVIPLEDIKEQITSLVIKEKKYSKILEDINLTDLASIADEYATSVVQGKQTTLATSNLQGVGYEPELIGSVFSNKEGVISTPIKGRNAVYVIQVTSIDEEVGADRDFSQQKLKIQAQTRAYSAGASYNVLKEAASIRDNRVEFF